MKKKILAGTPFSAETIQPGDVPLSPGDFEVLGSDASQQNEISRPSISYWQDAMRRLFQNKTAVVCIAILTVIILMAIIVPLVSPYSVSEQHLTHNYKGMFFRDPVDGHLHIFGTDELGRDLFTRVWHGTRTSLFIAFVAVFINLVVGITYGSISAYSGGWVDTLMQRFLEIVNGVPYLMVVILMRMVMDGSAITLAIAYAVVGWIGMARLVRGQILGLKNQEFVVAARSLGASGTRIIARHMVPNILSVVIVSMTLAIPNAIFTEAFLSFIGMGVSIPNASLGTLCQSGVTNFQMYPYLLFIPAFFISITMLAFNLLGDGLRDAFDPRLRR